jgi:2-iminobutanoate/2-iminopropanoate deaminase
MKKIISTRMAPGAIGPYSQAVKTGGFVFLSGQIAIDPVSGQIEADDVASQAKQVMDNLSAVLEEAGGSLADLVKTTVYLIDLNDFSLVNEVYGSYFSTDPPARATVEVSRLPREVLVEIDGIAVIS